MMNCLPGGSEGGGSWSPAAERDEEEEGKGEVKEGSHKAAAPTREKINLTYKVILGTQVIARGHLS